MAMATLRRPVIYALLALVLVFLVSSSVATRSEHRVAAIKEARADSLFSRMLEREHHHARERHAMEELIIEASVARDSLIAEADRARAKRPAYVAIVEQVAGDSAAVMKVVAEMEYNHERETDALRKALAAADAIIAAKDSIIIAQDSLNASMRLAIYAARSEARAWEDAAQPGFLGISIGPKAGFVGGVLVTLAAFVVLR